MHPFTTLFLAVLGVSTLLQIWLARRHIANVQAHRAEVPAAFRDAIPLEARMFALADALDAITSHRPYRKERDFKTAEKEIQKNKRSQFDPAVVEAFCSVKLEEWEKIRYETTKIFPNMDIFAEMLNRAA